MDTILHRLSQWAKESPEDPAQHFKEGGEWKTITARELGNRVYYLALFLESRGFTPDDAGAIFSYNCPEWVQLDLANVLRGARSAGLYPNASAKDIRYILEHTGATVLGVQNEEYFRKLGELPESVRLLIVFDGEAGVHPRAIRFSDAIDEGARIAHAPEKKKLSEYLSALDPHAGLIMIYTSGTTGQPKGALLSLDNLTYTAQLAADFWRMPVGGGSLFSFLPLCHIAEKMQCIGVGITRRYAVSFATKMDHVPKEMPEIQPILLLSVPRLWEKMMEGVLAQVEKTKGPKRKLADWALAVGARAAATRYAGERLTPRDRIALVAADRLVLAKIRQAMGLGKAERLASGAAALPAHVSRWFHRLGLEILEDYGQTETTGVVCMTEIGVDASGTVGKPVPGLEVMLAEDGEILTRGRHVFKGYFKDEAATAAVLQGGWLHTGDLGEVNERGMIRIRGRKKEIMKTSGGKMIAPLPIEEAIKASRAIGQVCLVGDGRKYVSALITLSEPWLAELKARRVDLAGRTVDDAATAAEIRHQLDEVNGGLASYEQVKKFTVLAKEFSVAEGEMTPTLKIKRDVIEKSYAEVIEGMYPR